MSDSDGSCSDAPSSAIWELWVPAACLGPLFPQELKLCFLGRLGLAVVACPARMDSAVTRLQCRGTGPGWGCGNRPLGFGGKLRNPILACQGCLNKVPQPAGLNNRNLSSHGSRGRKFAIKASAGVVPSEGQGEGCVLGLAPCLRMAALFLCLHVIIPVCICVEISSSYKDTSHMD